MSLVRSIVLVLSVICVVVHGNTSAKITAAQKNPGEPLKFLNFVQNLCGIL